MQRVIATLAILLLVIGNIAVFADALDVDQQADVLSSVNLLKGNGTDYNLSGKLTRAEAATFIVKFLGEEENLMYSGQKYTNPSFSDIDPKGWYMPYVGYVEVEEIASGFPDGTFRPTANVSEKAFLTMVLKALGYTNSDFSWGTVYSFAYEVGLVSDASYQVKTVDEMEYHRSDVVQVLYNSLDLPVKGSNQTALERLVDKRIVDEEVAIATGLYNRDELVSAISAIEVSSASKFTVTLNETISEITDDQLRLQSDDEDIDLTIESQKNEKLSFSTDVDLMDKEYTLTIENVTDQYGYVNTLEKTFTGYQGPIVSELFKIADAKAIDRETIQLEFTQPINLNAEHPKYYDIKRDGKDWIQGGFGTLDLVLDRETDNTIFMHLSGNQLDIDSTYTIVVSNSLRDLSGSKLQDSREITIAGSNQSPEGITLEDLIFVDKRTVKIRYNRPIDTSEAKRMSNYHIKKGSLPVNLVQVAVVPGENAVLLSVLSDFDNAKSYTFTIEGIEDAFGLSEFEDEFEINGSGSDYTANQIDFAYAKNEGEIEVYFEKPLKASTADNIAYYTIRRSGYNALPIKVLFDERTDARKVTLYLQKANYLQDDKEYILEIADGLQNIVNQGDEIEYTLDGLDVENQKPYPYDAVYIGDDKVRITFSEPISNSSVNTSRSNIQLKYKDSDGDDEYVESESVSYINPTTIVATFEKFDVTEDYKVVFNVVQDYAGVDTRTSSDGNLSRTVRIGE